MTPDITRSARSQNGTHTPPQALIGSIARSLASGPGNEIVQRIKYTVDVIKGYSLWLSSMTLKYRVDDSQSEALHADPPFPR